MTPTEKKTHTDKLEEYQVNKEEFYGSVWSLFKIVVLVIVLKLIVVLL